MAKLAFIWKSRWALFLILALCTSAHASDKALFNQIRELAERGIAEAQYHVGMMYNNGIGTKKDPQQAFNWFSKAANAGDVLGAYKLGAYYLGQVKDVVVVDEDKALYHILVAAKAGYSFAQHDIGIIYYKRKQFDEALHWWKQAAEQGCPMSLNSLSALYHAGQAVPRDDVFAYSYFKLAKLRSEGPIKPKAQSTLDHIKSAMTAAEVEKAEQIVSGWHANPTPLTLKAKAGLEQAKRLLSESRK